MVKRNQFVYLQQGQGMTEYVIIVALIAIAAIGIYQAFGDVVRGQTSVAASTLAGQESNGARTLVNKSGQDANNKGKAAKTLKDFESGAN